MRLRREIVDFIRLDLHEEPHQAARIRQIAIVQDKPTAQRLILQKMVDALRAARRMAADDAVNVISFREQELGKIRAVLPRDTGD